MDAPLIIRLPLGVVAFIEDKLFLATVKNRKSRKEREGIISELKAADSVTNELRDKSDFCCPVAEVNQVVIHNVDCCEVLVDGTAHTIKFSDQSQQAKFVERLCPASAWETTKSQGNFKLHEDTDYCVIWGGALALLAFGFYFGDWKGVDETSLVGKKQGMAALTKDFVELFGNVGFIVLSLIILLITAAVVVVKSMPKPTTVLTRQTNVSAPGHLNG